MKIQHPNLVLSQQAARDAGIRPVYFFWIVGKDRSSGAAQPMGLWTGDEDITVSVQDPTGGTSSRHYLGGCNLVVDGIQYVADLTDNPITVSMSQIAGPVQQLVRVHDVRLAYCELHSTTMTGGALTSPPDLDWVGIVDEAPIATPSVGSDGGIALSVRSELMSMLTATNPAKSSDAHQKRRQAGDRFSEYASIIHSRKVQWFKG